MASFTLNINGKQQQVEAAADTPLLWALRDNLDLVGTKYGCGIAQCGACTVHLNGQPMRACQMTIESIGDKKVTTIEGLADGEKLHPVQQAWCDDDVSQCGYCQAGQIMSAAALLKDNPNPTDEDINAAMAGNICRCGSYNRIRKAIHTAAGKLG